MVTAAAKAYNGIRVGILEARYPPQSHLSESALAEEIGVSRTPVREALRRLAADGFVTFLPNRGAFVNNWSEKSIFDLIDVRAELAQMAARLAAGRIGKADITTLRSINHSIGTIAAKRPAGYLTDLAVLNLKFHDIIYRNTGNEWLPALLRQTSSMPLVQRAHHGYRFADWKGANQRYDDLISALQAGDGEWAGALMKSHFLASKQAIKASLGRQRSAKE